jgi:adenylate cyclase
MRDAEKQHILNWIIEHGLLGETEGKLLEGFCERCFAAGLPLSQGMILVDTLHPVHGGHIFSWKRESGEGLTSREYESSQTDRTAQLWRSSPFYYMLATGVTELRRRIGQNYSSDFTILEDLRAERQTDYFAMVHRFGQETTIGEMDSVCTRWSTSASEGFSDDDLAALRSLVSPLSLAVKAYSLTRIAKSLVEAYLGRDAGERVLQGHMSRGTAEMISAVLWFSDLRGYTSISESASPDQILPLLNDYAEAVISAVHGCGGDVLKLIGDGTLAIFKGGDSAEACRSALRAEADLRNKIEALNARRQEQNQPVTSVYLGLHIGDVFYGNIGSRERLDFTVIGPAVNEVGRIASMCRSVDRHVLLSSSFVETLPHEERSRFVSVGRYALRGSNRPQELFTLDPERLN